MYSFFQQQNVLRFLLSVVFLLSTLNLPLLAQEPADEAHVTNVRVARQGRINIFVEYDLVGSSNEQYIITLAVKSKSDSSYIYTPLNVIGDIGANIREGKNKRINWRVADEYPSILSSADVQFVVNATPLPSSGTNTDLFLVGGAAVIGVALAIVFLSSNKAEPGQTSNVFPLPPGRP